DVVASQSAKEAVWKLSVEKLPVFDVRKRSEFNAGHVVDAHNTPLDSLNDHLSEFPNDVPFYVHCAGGYRSIIAASILKSRGIHNLINVEGGYGTMQKEGMAVAE